jgi:hypothetical protein
MKILFGITITLFLLLCWYSRGNLWMESRHSGTPKAYAWATKQAAMAAAAWSLPLDDSLTPEAIWAGETPPPRKGR